MTRLLSDYFENIAYKQLSAVEANPSQSNQHEFNGIINLKELFGSERKEIEVLQIYLDDQSEDPSYAKSKLTWYDARKNHETRTEYRLYYQSSLVTDKFEENDLMIIAKLNGGKYFNIFAKHGSSAENQIKLLFGISEISNKIETQTIEGSNNPRIDFIRNFIINKLGFLDDTSEEYDYLGEMMQLFPNSLPSTKIFSEYARSTVNTENLDVDSIIMKWWERETFLFKLYEKNQFDTRINKDQNDIDSFIEFSLSLQNTRKSRAGYALENHLEQILLDNGIAYSRTQVTENNSKPDFIFPSIEQYRNPNFPETGLHMLGVKTSCKDRWRQVLPEANRISHKHLLTLEPGISQNQTDEMKAHNLTLVLPEAIHFSYSSQQQSELLTVGQFVEIVKS